jgi:uncharacterized membrane protein
MRTALAVTVACLSLGCTPRDDQPADSGVAAPDIAIGDTAATAPRPKAKADTAVPAVPKAPTYEIVAGPSFRLVGNEPFWSLQIDSSMIRYRTPDDTSGTTFPPVKPLQLGDTLRWTASNPSTIIEAFVVPQACSDGMSDRSWTHKASVTIGSRKLEGCAERR